MLDQLFPLAARAAAMLRERGQTIAVADGATGGLISAGLLTVSGATDFCRGGGVIYSLRGRNVLLGLGREELAGMESATEPYALLQARAIRDRFGSDWGIAETGSAGPLTHPRGVPAGRSAIAVAGPGVEIARTIETGDSDRIANMGAFAMAALELLVDVLAETGEPGRTPISSAYK
ncbi:CinA family protein [Rhizorhabdus dicambivorans]|uniref:CinA family protein n=1 Tax=Rhizorhabdus dicambivorans TaxID=1850238 RepID=A0A2A4FTS6_9SPHN|nr:CinA family protein [Rhizorhabdus dicambivorans]ATE66959.1 CinA family protein [Rhizorhabdus dicambivorans]PCE42167.1 CinA family protein [Rhizorhabdus dicambivorans]